MRRFLLFLLAGLLLAASTPKSEMDRYIDDLMSHMTLEQKIGQLNLHSAPGFISAERVTEEDENMKLLRRDCWGASMAPITWNSCANARRLPWNPARVFRCSSAWM